MQFTHLHVHSHYSLLDGLPKIPALVSHAKSLGMDALALTDHGALYGAIEFYQECITQGIKPIVGCELYVAQRTLQDKHPKLDNKPYHLVVLAQNYTGYKNLLKLISRANLEGYYYKPRVDIELLKEFSEGLIALSACLNGQVARTILNKNNEAAAEVIKQYQGIFGKENFFLELQHNPNTPEQITVNTALKELTQLTQAPLVATADTHYLKPEDANAQDILVCIQTKHQLADQNRLTMRNEDYAFVNGEQIAEWFKDTPEAITNTQVIAERCDLKLPLGEIHMPYYDLPPDKTADEVLKELCLEGISKYYPTTDRTQVIERLDYELGVIIKTGYASYFLIVQDLVNWSKQQGIVVGPGRGSAAGSIVAYLTGITSIDPLRYDLLFERFLNPERVSMPDIDLDIADTRRDEVIRYVESKYGKDHVAQIITFGTMAARAAIRDVGRVLGLGYGFCDTISKLIPMFSSLQDAITQVPELKDLYQSDADATRLIDESLKLEGVVRHTSTHACGVVITKQPLVEYTPVQYSSSGDESIVTQYSLHPVEALGLLKMDFLGLKNLTLIEDTINLAQATTGTQIDIDTLPLDDKKTYTLLKKSQTTGIFQLESAGMKRYLRELKPSDFEDIIAMVALYRPGPMERIPDYVAGKHGKRQITYLHPKLEPILQKTYGILVYQEQVMALVRDIAGFTTGEGYLLIKAVAKKIESLLNEQKERFINGCKKNQVSENVAQKIWEFIEPFARYGFNKSHSTGYALIAYQTAYLKANYPAQFMASLLTVDQADSDRIAIEVQETRDMGIAVLPPDVNESFSTFTVVKESLSSTPRIRFGLAAIKNVGQKLIDALIKERKANGPYLHIEDLLDRIHHKDLNRKSLESLIKSGAFDALGDSSTLLHNIDTLVHINKQSQQEHSSGQVNLFGALPMKHAPALHLQPGPVIDVVQKLQWEKDLLGLYVSSHPLSTLQNKLPAGLHLVDDLKDIKSGANMQVVGIIGDIRRVLTKNNESMQFVRLEGPGRIVEVVIFPSAAAAIKTLLTEGSIIKVHGSIRQRNGEQKMIAEEITHFDHHYIVIHLETTTDRVVIQDIHTILSKHPGDLPVYVNIGGRSIKADSCAAESVLTELQQLLGNDTIYLV